MTKTDLPHPISRAAGHVFTSEPNNLCSGEKFGEGAKICSQLQRRGSGDLCPPAGVQEETQLPLAQEGKKVPAQLPRCGASQREVLWVEGVHSCPEEPREKGQGSSGKNLTYQLQGVCAHFGPAARKACWESSGKEKHPLARELC